MKNIFYLGLSLLLCSVASTAQKISGQIIPAAVITALSHQFPKAKHVSWERENGNYEANWGGKSGEDNSVQFSPKGTYVEMEQAISVHSLPAKVIQYVHMHHKGMAIHEAARTTDSAGKVTYEAEVSGKDLIFDSSGNFLSTESGTD